MSDEGGELLARYMELVVPKVGFEPTRPRGGLGGVRSCRGRWEGR